MEGSTESIKYKAKTKQQEVHLENKINCYLWENIGEKCKI